VRAFVPLIAEIWREACRHIEIDEAAERIAALIRRHLPLDTLAIRRLEVARACVETIAATGTLASTLLAFRSDLSAGEIEDIAAWGRSGRVLSGAKLVTIPGGSKLAPPDLVADVLIGPLAGVDGHLGAVLLVARTGKRFEHEHRRLVRALLEPLSVALDNDAQLREISSQREAAEADRRSLLTRLGRPDLQQTIVGEEGGLRLTMQRARLVAPSDVPVLLLGETGSGKEVIARAIHLASPRAAHPFLRVNCGAISPGLIDSELFGHDRGSFTGAANEHKGWFERAHGGTLFLDEAAELPLEVQVRLLRVLQDGTFERVGGQRTLHADVRVIGATHRDLPTMVGEGRFREDLWYRLAVFPIHLPPLRARPEDIPALAVHFAARAAIRFGLPSRPPTSEDVDLLVSYPWPGNVRELIAVMERAVILGEGRSLEVAKALGVGQGAATSRPLHTASATALTPIAGAGDILPLDLAMARHIEMALARTEGRIEGAGGAARILGINPHTLRARMRKLGVDWQRFRQRDAQ